MEEQAISRRCQVLGELSQGGRISRFLVVLGRQRGGQREEQCGTRGEGPIHHVRPVTWRLSLPVYRARLLFSIKRAVQEPALVFMLPEEPQARAQMGFDDVVIAVNVAAAPPAGLDAFGPPAISDRVFLSEPQELARRPRGKDRQHVDRQRDWPYLQGAVGI